MKIFAKEGHRTSSVQVKYQKHTYCEILYTHRIYCLQLHAQLTSYLICLMHPRCKCKHTRLSVKRIIGNIYQTKWFGWCPCKPLDKSTGVQSSHIALGLKASKVRLKTTKGIICIIFLFSLNLKTIQKMNNIHFASLTSMCFHSFLSFSSCFLF